VLLPGNRQVARENQKKQDQAALNDADAALHRHDCQNDRRLARRAGDRDHQGDKNHDQGGPFKQHGSKVLERVVRPENVKENFVYDLEPDRHADSRPGPVTVKVEVVAPILVSRENHSEVNDLEDYVREEHREFTIEVAPEYRDAEE